MIAHVYFFNILSKKASFKVENLPVWARIAFILFLLILSACFSVSETAMLSINKHRLRYLANKDIWGAKTTQRLLNNIDSLLSFILIGSNLINTLIPVLTTSLTLTLFGQNNLALITATGIVAFLIIVISEITPKIVGASYPEKIALPAGLLIHPLLLLFCPLVWFINTLSKLLLRAIGIPIRKIESNHLSLDEIRSLVIDSSTPVPKQSKKILMNLFDLEQIVVEDVMIPRKRLESINLLSPSDQILLKLRNCQHNHIVFYEEDINHIVGILHIRQLLAILYSKEKITPKTIRNLLLPPYFVPNETAVFQQLKFFQENQKRFGIVVDEYGDVIGIVTPEDIIEEIIGEFTTNMSQDLSLRAGWDNDNVCTVTGSVQLRALNRNLGLNFQLDGPKTLSGLILENLSDMPNGNVCIEFKDCRIESLKIENNLILLAKISRKN